MNSLSPNKPSLIVTIGPPGSGKSFFARRFADTFHAPLISFDEIRSELFNEITHSNDEDVIVARMAGLQLRELLRTKKTIVIDGGHNARISRAQLQKLVRPLGYNILYIWVQTDLQAARSRSLKRRADQEDDRYNRNLSDDEFVMLSKKFTPPNKLEPVVVISGRHTYPTQARIVLKRLSGNHETKSPTAPKRPDVSRPQRGPIRIS